MITDRLEGDRALRASQVEWNYQPTMWGELGHPRRGNVPHPDGGNDAVVRGQFGPTPTAITAADRDLRNPTCGQALAGVCDEVGVDVHRHHGAGLADQMAQQRRVVAAAGPDLEHSVSWLHIELVQHSRHDRGL